MHTEIRSSTKQVIEGKLAASLGVRSGDEWLVIRGVARAVGKQVPVCWSDYYIHRDYVAINRVLPRYSGPIFVLIEDFFGITVAEIDQDIATSTITAALAAQLKAKTGTTSIEVRRTYRTATGKVVQISVHTHPASRFGHSMKMRRFKA